MKQRVDVYAGGPSLLRCEAGGYREFGRATNGRSHVIAGQEEDAAPPRLYDR